MVARGRSIIEFIRGETFLRQLPQQFECDRLDAALSVAVIPKIVTVTPQRLLDKEVFVAIKYRLQQLHGRMKLLRRNDTPRFVQCPQDLPLRHRPAARASKIAINVLCANDRRRRQDTARDDH